MTSGLADPALMPDGPPDRPSPRPVDRTMAAPPLERTILPGAPPPSANATRPDGAHTWMTFPGDAAPPSVAPAERDEPKTVGDFELLERLGRGGMGEVWRARQRSLARDVAVKLLAPGYAAGEQAAARFVREARAAAAVNHPNVITIIAAGKDAASGRLYMAMELLRGGDAEQLATAAGGRLEERRALEVVRDCARALEAEGLWLWADVANSTQETSCELKVRADR